MPLLTDTDYMHGGLWPRDFR